MIMGFFVYVFRKLLIFLQRERKSGEANEEGIVDKPLVNIDCFLTALHYLVAKDIKTRN